MKTRRSDDRQSYVAARNFAEHIKKVAKLESWKNIEEDLKKDMEGKKKLLFSLTKCYRGRYNELSYAVKDRNGELLMEPERIAERWREYFSQLLNVGGIDGEGQETVPVLDDLQHDGQESQITLEELKAAISQMKRGKAAGDDGIPVEILKAGGNFAEQ